MASLETKVGKETSAIVREGLDGRLVQACRKKAVESRNPQSDCYESFSGSYTLNLIKANDIPMHIESYKSCWSELESLSNNPNFPSIVNFDYLRGIVDDFKTERKMLVGYAYQNTFARLAYHADKKISNIFERMPLWAKLLLLT